jgi:hypothetical protein
MKEAVALFPRACLVRSLFLAAKSMKTRERREKTEEIERRVNTPRSQPQYLQTARKHSARSNRQTTMNAPAPSVDDEHPPPWLSPPEIAAELGVSPQRIGQTINRLGLRGNLGGFVRAVIVKKGRLWSIEGYVYSSKAVRMIADQLVDDGFIPRTVASAGPHHRRAGAS